jgi:hypothetical protein
MNIEIKSQTIPSFTQLGPYCKDATLSPLPSTSINNITGTWSPILDNTKTTEYTFTPSQGQCADITKMTITINSNVTPSFDQVSPICSNETLNPLPGTSLNNITGTWSPILDNTKTTEYTFTPSQGQCAVSLKMIIIVNNNPITGEIQNLTDVCIGKSLNISSSISGGSWSSSNTNVAIIDQNGLITSISKGITNIKYTITENNCSNSIEQNMNVNECASLTNETTDNIYVFPNPVINELTVKQKTSLFDTYKIIDVVGKIILEGKLTSEESILNVQKLMPGQYLFRLETNEGELKDINFNKN